MNPQFSPYDYFSYFFPGATIFGAYFLAASGFPTKEPGAIESLTVVGVAYLIGHVVASVSTWFEPILWGHRPGGRTDPEWGMFGAKGAYKESERLSVVAELRKRYGDEPFRTAYNLAYTELQQVGKDGQLKVMNQQIGFYRNMSVACLLAALTIGVAAVTGQKQLPPLPWVPFFALAGGLFIYRYRRFWRYFGDNVVRGLRALPPAKDVG